MPSVTAAFSWQRQHHRALRVAVTAQRQDKVDHNLNTGSVLLELQKLTMHHTA